ALAELAHELAGVGDVGEHEVEQQRVRPVAAELVDRFATGARRRHDLHVAVLLEHLAEEQLHGERVVADRHADRPVHRTERYAMARRACPCSYFRPCPRRNSAATSAVARRSIWTCAFIRCIAGAVRRRLTPSMMARSRGPERGSAVRVVIVDTSAGADT